LARERKNVAVLLCVCLVASLVTISIVAIAVGVIPVALTALAGVLALNLASVVRYYFVQRHRR
jgi:membrane protein YqaA with SNARE-associated domain